MSVLVNKDTRVVISGITGGAGSFHAKQCIDYGTNIVAGVTPGKGGQIFEGKVPVFNTIRESVEKEGANACAIFVPPAFAAAPAREDRLMPTPMPPWITGRTAFSFPITSGLNPACFPSMPLSPFS